jgi:hypothetical protein
MDKNEYAKQVYGLKVGDPVSPAMGAQIEKELEYYRKKKVDALVKQQFEPAAQSTPDRPVGIGYITNAPRVTMETDAAGNVITNTNSGPIVHQVEKFSDGTFKIIPASHVYTALPDGRGRDWLHLRTSGPITNEITGEPEMNYSSDPSTGGMPQPGIGGAGMAVTNAPTAAPCADAGPLAHPGGCIFP